MGGQLFAHFGGGGALNVAFILMERERANWECLSQSLSDYYNSPGRLAVFRRQFESATRRPGMDPATLAMELEILAVRGFGDMGKRARDWMIRDTFITAQRSCGLRRHLDGVPPGTPIRDIVDRCRVWESHLEQESGKRSLNDGVGEGVFLVRTAGTWGEPVFAGGHFFSVLVADLVGECPEWPVSGDTDGGTGVWSTPGNEGWSGREGQPPGPLGPRYD